ncbi:enoyl-CoA hydratase [Aquitalea magnusonii]|uniref:Enoyl-CoA hydratase n=1 Tax=Aquitalea magnusonii TaxID=332411 RepID=A0A3G9GF25_9NEIS|nr:crotonase/enoyl-CoA hydratase family protein [Aquitalea magnusonii]BBF85423.1 enoyl-CoA hydratase [Aquitalea magnusonii]
MQWQTFDVGVEDKVALVRFNRADKANALNQTMWQELQSVMEWADAEPAVRAVVLAGHGKHFCSGIDLSMLMGIQGAIANECEGRQREKLRRLILQLQDNVSSLERCRKPVVAAIHGACLGGGLDIALAADFRFAAADAVFGVREVDIGMVADVGTLQRLPGVVGQGVAREMALTGRDVAAEEALRIGLVNRLLPDADGVLAAAMASAALIASKSPLAVRGSKEMLNYARDHSVADSLNHVATWNAAMLLSEDIQKAAMASMTRQTVVFRD